MKVILEIMEIVGAFGTGWCTCILWTASKNRKS